MFLDTPSLPLVIPAINPIRIAPITFVIKVKKGTYVVAGDVLGKAGVDSMTKKNGIMLMVVQNGEYIDPAKAPRG